MAQPESPVIRAACWRRLAAFWVDLFVVWALASLLVLLADLAGLRLALEPAGILTGALYGGGFLACGRQTLGKVLLGVGVIPRRGGSLGVGRALLRESVAKWLVAVAGAPALVHLAVARGWTGTCFDLPAPALAQAWVPSVFELAIALPALAVQLLFLLVAQHTWYDWLLGVEVARCPADRRRTRQAVLLLAGAAILGLGAKGGEFAARGWLPCRLAVCHRMASTAPYVAFLRQGQPAPVDYILGLFERYDVVVLCERVHPEMTQWNLIYQVASDPRFADRVGHVFTEYGSVAMQAPFDSLMATDGLAPDEASRRIVQVLHQMTVWPTWINTNFYTYLTRLYTLNQSLPKERRIRHYFIDEAVDWAALQTPQDYQEYKRTVLPHRDRYMAQTIIDELPHLGPPPAGGPPKALVVMNYRHAFGAIGKAAAGGPFNTYEFLVDSLGDRAANVLLNTDIFGVPIAGGIWDAAFAETGSQPVGFDLAGSPFGEEPFDLFPFLFRAKGLLRYDQVFAGFVYDLPVLDQYQAYGIPGYYQGFAEEALRRWRLLDNEQGARFTQTQITREQQGAPAVQRDDKPLCRLVQTMAETGLLGLASIGLVIGLLAGFLRLRESAPAG